jgi:hypothetical protein
MPSNDPDCFGLTARQPAAVVGKAAGPKAHVLVCAPSNAGACACACVRVCVCSSKWCAGVARVLCWSLQPPATALCCSSGSHTQPLLLRCRANLLTHTALDELVLRILQHGLLDGSGNRCGLCWARVHACC